jgi:hypothetical protein
MSAAPIRTPESDPAPVREIPALTDAYRKAHKSYVLFAGLLASWELIGITINTKEKWGVELKSPAAIPLILFTLVFYSGYKMTIEWLQCDAERRKHFAARTDYWVAHAIAIVAVGISVVQYLWRIRIVDILSNSFNGFAFAIFLAVPSLYLTVRFLMGEWRKFKHSRAERWRAIAGVLVLLFLTVAAGIQPFQEKNGIFTFELGLGSGIVSVAFFEIIAFVLKRRQA